jgi:hypothetical protein
VAPCIIRGILLCFPQSLQNFTLLAAASIVQRVKYNLRIYEREKDRGMKKGKGRGEWKEVGEKRTKSTRKKNGTEKKQKKINYYYYYYYLFLLQMDFYPVSGNTISHGTQNNPPRSNKAQHTKLHNSKGHTLHTMNTIAIQLQFNTVQ